MLFKSYASNFETFYFYARRAINSTKKDDYAVSFYKGMRRKILASKLLDIYGIRMFLSRTRLIKSSRNIKIKNL